MNDFFVGLLLIFGSFALFYLVFKFPQKKETGAANDFRGIIACIACLILGISLLCRYFG
jgi:hypothetical protein